MFCLSEVTLVESLESLTVASLVLGHLVNRVMDGIQVQGLGLLGNIHLAGASSAFGFHTLLEVGLGIPDALANQLCKTAGVIGLLKGIALEGLGDFRIAFAVSLARHSQIHSYFGTFTFEVGLQAFPDLRVAALGHANLMLGDKLQAGIFAQLFELAGRSFTLGAAFRGFGTFENVTANCADKFL